MELQFPKSTFAYLRRAAWEIKNEEQTQEVKLSESLPDIGRILGAWGQPLVRSKEWRGSSMGISGGVMAWVLYAPEEGGPPRCVETWIPFQMQWDFAQTQHDGSMLVSCLLKGIDARSISARKMMVRSMVSAAGEALEPVQAELFQPGEVPEDVQLLRMQYPVRLPRESGEKVITLDEELTPSCGNIRRIIHCSIQPELIDQKVMADKVVFRGAAMVHMLCECEDGTIEGCDFEIPFSQYAELERDYDPYATAEVIPAVTNLEPDIQDNGTLRLKAGIVGQYVIYDRPVFEVITDAYSTKRAVSMEHQRLELPAVLDVRQEIIKAEAQLEQDGQQMMDMAFALSHPMQRRSEQGIQMEIPGSFQILRNDNDGNLMGNNVRWEGELNIPVDEEATMLARCSPKGKPKATGMGISCDVTVDMLATATTNIPMVTVLELGDVTEPDHNRPSMILRRVGNDTMWDIAKMCGSTVDAIKEANGMTGEPETDQILLIPVS